MSLRSKELNNIPPPSYDSDNTLVTMKFYHSGTLEDVPNTYYKGGKLSIFDEVETVGLSLYELDRMLETIELYGQKKYYVRLEEFGFHRITSDRELHNVCMDAIGFKREVEFYLEVSLTGDLVELLKETDNDVEDDDDYEASDDSEDSDNSSLGDWSENDSEYDMEDDQNLEKNVEGKSVEVSNQTESDRNRSISKKSVKNLRSGDNLDINIYDGEEDEITDSDKDFEGVHESDDEFVERDPLFNAEKEMYNPPFKCGLIFSDFKEFKEAVMNWNIKRGRQYKFIKNDKLRVRAVCPIKNCNWTIYARKMKGDSCVQIRTFIDKHRCGFTYKNKCVKSRWVGKRHQNLIIDNPHMNAFTFRKMVMKDSKCFLSKTQGYKARKIALKLVQGSDGDQYQKLNDYIHEVQRTNPGSTVIMKMVDGFCDRVTKQPKFERMYMCFSGVKQGFLAGCRPVFGLDGTFLKGECRGILLTAVGIDPDNGIFPIAYAVVEGENKGSWTWFLMLLKEDLQIEKDYEWTLMSDKQKGLIQACESVFPNADHRFCVKHLHGNMSVAGFKSVALRKALWVAAKSTTPIQFRDNMAKMAEIDLDAVKWLGDKPPTEWSRSHFKTFPKCDILLNNICESFNSKILDAREQPIVSMFESLRLYMMERMQENREKAQNKWQHNLICPKIFKIVEKNSEHATLCIPHKANNQFVEVWCPYGEKYVVNLQDRTCACRRWDLTGIPCCHAISAIWTATEDPMDYVADCYKVQTYLKCYEPCIFPLNGENEWHKTELVNPLPPSYSKAPGRPKKLRRRSQIEVQEGKEVKKKLRRVGQFNSCSFCGQKGHNVRSCTARKVNNESIEGNNTLEADPMQGVHQPMQEMSSQKSSSTSAVKRHTKSKKKVDADPMQGVHQPMVEISSQSGSQPFGDKAKKANSAPTSNLYEVFGLPVPPFPVGSQPILKNTRGPGGS